jgi:hypothetical protein
MSLKILRVEKKKRSLDLITEQGEVFPAETVVLKMNKSGSVSIKVLTEKGERFLSFDRFFANMAKD